MVNVRSGYAFTYRDELKALKTKISERFGTLIRNKRIEKRLTQQEFAKAVGVTFGFVSDVERGNRAPPVDLALWGKVLDIPDSILYAYAGRLPPSIANLEPESLAGVFNIVLKDIQESFKKGA